MKLPKMLRRTNLDTCKWCRREGCTENGVGGECQRIYYERVHGK
jgi:hypothetical protein